MEIIIALVQLGILPGEPLTNLVRMDHFVERAKAQGADLVVFPEDAVCGPLNGQVDFVAYAQDYLAHFQALAAKYAIDIVPGSWTVAEGGLLYNQAHYISANGSLLGSYRKINLWPTEQAHITPGTQLSVFTTRFGRVGLILCWDISFPALFAGMVAQGAELVISPTYWSFTMPAEQVDAVIDDEILLIDSLCTTRAFENNILFAYCNAAGILSTPHGERVLSGRSQITHPLKKMVVKAEGNAEQLLMARVSLARAPMVPQMGI